MSRSQITNRLEELAGNLAFADYSHELLIMSQKYAALVEAAESVLAWRISDFDTIAEMFYRETGYLRPGKDYPVGMGGETVRKEAADAWNVWVDRKNAELTAQLTAAIAAAKAK